MTAPTTLFLADAGTAFQETVAQGPLVLAIGAALLAGMVSFASPCVIPLVPGYLAYLSSVVGAERPAASPQEARGATATLAATRRRTRWRVAGAALLFVAGFTVVFVLLSAVVLGALQYLAPQTQLLERIGGVVIILMGLVFIGFVPVLQRDTRMQPKTLTTWLGAPLLGGVFALGWTPCLGPTLASALALSAGTGTTAARGVALIDVYCLGLGLPFVVLAFGSTWAVGALAWAQRHTRVIQTIGGIALIIVGVLLLTGGWAWFVSWLRDFAISDTTLPI